MMLLASTTLKNIVRGATHDLWIKVKDEDEDIVDIESMTPILRLARSYTDEESVLEIEGNVFQDGSEGLCYFSLSPSDTQSLVARAYDMTVLLDEEPVLQDRIGVVAQNPSGGE